ncbi:RNA 2',3'-cyclic phosphodiesterase [Desulfosoma caldarium]|uniref:RNA 2',3'-cyclic phosphodiesterase n=1 Tax=Desulfosoma caldarium TaxID=610254 RepID=A0A3N1VL65_9BACT|nr:RNA 2',3'-cyclic phosphodiesterase [Desulfosoma caldarium]ROR03534.1 2'-5' RNA ligase [Desulfosoma caldarium]
MIRTFVALDLPPNVQKDLGEFCAPLQQLDVPVRWIRPHRVHLTLKFLGHIAPSLIEAVADALRPVAASTAPFSLRPAGCGAFPSLREMRVVWVGVQGDMGSLHALQRSVEDVLQPLGFPKEHRPFRAHLTIGRVKGRRHLKSLQDMLVARQGYQGVVFDVSELVLYKSDLKPDGAQYTPLQRWPFQGRSRL